MDIERYENRLAKIEVQLATRQGQLAVAQGATIGAAILLVLSLKFGFGAGGWAAVGVVGGGFAWWWLHYQIDCLLSDRAAISLSLDRAEDAVRKKVAAQRARN
jgi:hypothetical protein